MRPVFCLDHLLACLFFHSSHLFMTLKIFLTFQVNILPFLTILLVSIHLYLPLSPSVFLWYWTSSFLSGQYFALTILLVSLSTLCTVFVVNLHHKGSHGDQVPYWMKKLVLMWLSRLVCKRKLVNLTVDTRKPKERMLYQQVRIDRW